MAEGGPGSFVNIDDTDPAGQRALKKLKAQDYASAGLVMPGRRSSSSSAAPRVDGARTAGRTIWHSWTKTCPECGGRRSPSPR